MTPIYTDICIVKLYSSTTTACYSITLAATHELSPPTHSARPQLETKRLLIEDANFGLQNEELSVKVGGKEAATRRRRRRCDGGAMSMGSAMI